MTRLAVNGVRLEVRAGGQGMPLLLLHGFTGRGSSWAPHLPAFGRSHGTIVVDLLGHGRSDAPVDPARYAIERQADDLAALARAIGAPVADVLGYSMGARIALRLALDHPTAIRRLVLESPSAGIADATERARRRAADEALAETIERDGVAAFVDRWEGQPIFASHVALPAAARERLRRQRLGHTPAGLANALRGGGQGAMTPLDGRLGKVCATTLVVVGSLDPVGRERAAVIAGGIPGARFEVVEGAGHTPHLERPAVFRRLVIAFLAGTPDPPTH
ncbi:MAG: alpha/beta fold hydrolase [Chloroflexi bacterium]|nr:alpha/beta fold hydrolase [Chloroflexota bacterium]